MNYHFIQFCTYICTSRTAEELNDFPVDDNNFIDFASLYQNDKFRKEFVSYLISEGLYPIGTFEETFYPSKQ